MVGFYFFLWLTAAIAKILLTEDGKIKKRERENGHDISDVNILLRAVERPRRHREQQIRLQWRTTFPGFSE